MDLFGRRHMSQSESEVTKTKTVGEKQIQFGDKCADEQGEINSVK